MLLLTDAVLLQPYPKPPSKAELPPASRARVTDDLLERGGLDVVSDGALDEECVVLDEDRRWRAYAAWLPFDEEELITMHSWFLIFLV